MTDQSPEFFEPIFPIAPDIPPAPRVSIGVTGGVGSEAPATDGARRWRDAWVLDGAVIEVDMAAAREIHRTNLRRVREALWPPYDDVIRVLGRKAMLGTLTDAERLQAATAEAACQRLRDVTSDPRIEAAATPEDLAALTIEVLTAE